MDTHTHTHTVCVIMKPVNIRRTHWVDLELPDSATHVKGLAVDLFSLLPQLAVGVDLEHTSGVARNHLTAFERERERGRVGD